jgi:hypothetical protein
MEIHLLNSRFFKSNRKTLGLDIFELDSAWLSTMDSFGSKRGETAHASGKTQQPNRFKFRDTGFRNNNARH